MNLFGLIKNNVVDVSRDFPSGNPRAIVYLNPYTYNYFRKNISEIKNVGGFRFDGAYMVAVLRLFGISVPCRQSFDFTSLAPYVFEEAAKSNMKVYLCGGTKEDIDSFSLTISAIFPTLKICGYRNGYFSDDEMSAVSGEIMSASPDFVLLGLGGIKQERFASFLSVNTGVYIMTCGAFISQTAMQADYYPQWVKEHGFRWLYRFYKEPRVIKRVVFNYPKFFFLIILDMLLYKIQSAKKHS